MPQADWLEVVVVWVPFERRKIEVHIFERAPTFQVLVCGMSPPKET